MKELRYGTKFKKDLKKYRNMPQKMQHLFEVFNLLVNGIELPTSYRPHKLTGQYKGCMECHIENDLLLIWIDEDNNIIQALRLGTHSELFKK